MIHSDPERDSNLPGRVGCVVEERIPPKCSTAPTARSTTRRRDASGATRGSWQFPTLYGCGMSSSSGRRRNNLFRRGPFLICNSTTWRIGWFSRVCLSSTLRADPPILDLAEQDSPSRPPTGGEPPELGESGGAFSAGTLMDPERLR